MNLDFKFMPKNQYEILVFLLFFSLALMNWIPEIGSIDFFLFFSFFLFLLGVWFFDVARKKIISNFEIVAFFGISGLLIVNCLSAVLNGLQLIEWVRSASFIFTWFLFLFFIRFFKNIELEYLLTTFVLSGLFWMVINLVRLDSSIVNTFLSMSRITYANQNFLLPYPLMLSLILLLCFKNNILKIVLLVVSMLVMLATGYKAHILIFGLALVYYVIKNKKNFIVLVFLSLVPLYFLYDILYNYIIVRFQGVGGEGDLLRLREWEVALDIFYKNPIFGAGLGQTFNIGSGWGGEAEKSFIHNSVLYLLATMGGFGFLIITSFFSFILLKGRFDGVRLIVLLLLVSTLSAASYKLIHFNMMLIILVSISIFYNNGKGNGSYYSVK